MTYNDKGARPAAGVAGAEIRARRNKGLLGLPASPIRAYVRTRAGLDAPDAAISWIPFLADTNFKLAKNSGITAIMNILRSESTGSIHVSSKSPQHAAGDPLQLHERAARSRRNAGSDAHHPAHHDRARHAGIATDEIAPGVNIQSDDELLDWVRKNAETTYHPVGTCKMGSDPMAVVDDQLRVHGMQGLRVADASIMPTLTSGNTNAPSIMIGEKASRMMLAAAA